MLFDPYTMEILKTPYVPAAKLYEVQDFLTESTWYDVVLFDGTTIKVNAKAMPTLRITANHGYEAIPHVINYTAGDQYGNAGAQHHREARIRGRAVQRDLLGRWRRD